MTTIYIYKERLYDTVLISNIRSRGMSVCMAIQSYAQLESLYNKDAQTIIDNCDTTLFLGCNSVQTATIIAKRCNKPVSDILNLPYGDMIVLRRGIAPFKTQMDEPYKDLFEYNESPKDTLESTK